MSAFLEWCKDIGTLIVENKKITIVVVVFVLLVIGAITLSSVLGKKSDGKEVAIISGTESEEPESIAVPQEPFEVDAYPEINTLFKTYYQALADGNVDTILTIKTSVEEKEQIYIEKKSAYIEAYPTIVCYTKKGPIPDSFIVMPYYEVKLKDFEELMPALNSYYVCKNDKGQYYINNDELEENIANYCKAITVQDDVVDLVNSIQVKYNELLADNEKLSEFLGNLDTTITTEVGEELAKREAPKQEPETEETTEEPTTEETETDENVIKKVRTTDVVNVRSSDSETADKLGKTEVGQEFVLIEQKGNGWSKVEYEGKEAFIKSDYLEVVLEELEENDKQDDSTDTKTDEQATKDSPSEGTATVKTTVNVRAKASEKADKLGVCYQGDKLEVVQKLAEGWTKVKYKKKTGYVKSEYLE